MRDLNEELDEQFRQAVDRFSLRPVNSQWNELSGKIISIDRPQSMAEPVRSSYKKWALVLALLILFPVVQKSVTQMQNAALVPKTALSTATAEVKAIRPGPGHLESRLGLQDKEVQVQSSGVFTSKTNSIRQSQSVLFDKPESNENVVQNNHFPANNANNEQPVDPFNMGSQVLTTPSTNLTVSGLAPLTLQTNTGKNLPLQHLEYSHRQGFYIGISGGPLLTQVKNQGLKKSGFDGGLIGGYAFNKKFSIESGVYYTQQYYYVSGKYYNEFAGVNFAGGLEGRRTAFEIPLTVKYNFIRRAKGDFFATAGVSTFIGVTDKVSIQVAEGSIPPSVHFDYGASSYLPSYLNVSAGYEYKIGNAANIRIEPYVQIPLNNNTGNSFKTESTGGSIQVFNAGIHIAISRFIR
jgi:hypothetical protein